MKIVVTFAVRAEFANWRRSGFSQIEKAKPQVFRMKTAEAEVYALLTGIGMVSSRDELREMLGIPADFCIASGFAGGLRRQYKPGSIVVARTVNEETNRTILASDGPLVAAAVRCGADPVNLFFTSKTIVNATAERLKLAKIADAVDMESYHVLAEARRAGIPAVAVRAISDSPDEPLPIDFDRVVDGRGEVRWLDLLAQVANQPGQLAKFTRFGIHSLGAARNLARFLNRYVKFLATNESVRISLHRVATT
jgi:adenosylhomocysteine nucleosidase